MSFDVGEVTERLENEQSANASVASPMSQLILPPIFRFSYVTGSSLTSPGKPPMLLIEIFNNFLQELQDIYSNSKFGFLRLINDLGQNIFLN